MQIKIQQWGNSAAIRLNRGILDQLPAKIGDVLDLEVNGNRLLLRPSMPKYTMDELLKKSSKSSFSLSDDDKLWLNSTIGKEEP